MDRCPASCPCNNPPEDWESNVFFLAEAWDLTHRPDCSTVGGGDCTCGVNPPHPEDYAEGEDPPTADTEVVNLVPVAWERMGHRVMLDEDDDIPF